MAAMLLVCLRNAALVTRALVLVTADFLVLALTLLHERRQLGVVVLGHGLGRHPDRAVSTGFCNVLLDVDDGLLKGCDTRALVEAL